MQAPGMLLRHFIPLFELKVIKQSVIIPSTTYSVTGYRLKFSTDGINHVSERGFLIPQIEMYAAWF